MDSPFWELPGFVKKRVGFMLSITLTVRVAVVVLLLESVALYKTSKLLIVVVLRLSGV